MPRGGDSVVRLVVGLATVGMFGALALGCQNYSGQLERAQLYYADNQYEQALAVFRHLEADQSSLDEVERVRYCYLRGMTDVRLGYRTHARYWLGLANAAQRSAREALDPDERERLAVTLSELDREAFGITEAPSPVMAETQQLGTPCEWTSECETGLICQDGSCVEAS